MHGITGRSHMSSADLINSEQDQSKGTKLLLVDDEEGYVTVLAKRLVQAQFSGENRPVRNRGDSHFAQ